MNFNWKLLKNKKWLLGASIAFLPLISLLGICFYLIGWEATLITILCFPVFGVLAVSIIKGLDMMVDAEWGETKKDE